MKPRILKIIIPPKEFEFNTYFDRGGEVSVSLDNRYDYDQKNMKEVVFLAVCPNENYGLYFYKGRYRAGCRDFTYRQAVAHWKHNSQEDPDPDNTWYNRERVNRAKLFLAAIEKHQVKLKAKRKKV